MKLSSIQKPTVIIFGIPNNDDIDDDGTPTQRYTVKDWCEAQTITTIKMIDKCTKKYWTNSMSHIFLDCNAFACVHVCCVHSYFGIEIFTNQILLHKWNGRCRMHCRMIALKYDDPVENWLFKLRLLFGAHTTKSLDGRDMMTSHFRKLTSFSRPYECVRLCMCAAIHCLRIRRHLLPVALYAILK